jgi:hypothetical protein
MIPKFNRRKALSAVAALGLMAGVGGSAIAQDLVQLRLSMAGSETDQRSVAMAEVFAPAVSEFAELRAVLQRDAVRAGNRARGDQPGQSRDVDRLGAGAGAVLPGILDLHRRLCAPGRRPPGRGLQRPADGPVQAEGRSTSWACKLLSVMYLGRRHVNLRQCRDELTCMTPADLAGVNLRMPGTDAWQFLGAALGASPTPMAFTEVYTALSTGRSTGRTTRCRRWSTRSSTR